jgi:hypothetical protein
MGNVSHHFFCDAHLHLRAGASVEGIPFRGQPMMSLQNRMQTVLGLRCQSGHFFALGYQATQFTNFLRGHPHPHQQSLCQ